MGKLAAMGTAPVLRSFGVSHECCEHRDPPAHPRHQRPFLLLSQAVSTRSPEESRVDFRNFSYAFTAGLTSAINLFIELYVVVRFVTLQLPFFLIRHDRRVFADLRLLRALSLLLLDILTVFPSIHFVNIAADYIPSALGMIPVLLAFNHQPPRGYSLSSSSTPSRWSMKSTHLPQPSASIGTSVQSLNHILPIHTPPSTFEIRSSEYASPSDSPSYQRPQSHPFGAIALNDQSALSGYRYPRRAAMDATRPGTESPAGKLPSPRAVQGVDSKSPTFDASSIPSSVDEENLIRISTSTRRSFLPALPTMAGSADAEVPSDVEPVQPPPTAAVNAPTSALVPRTRQILPNQAAVATELPRGRDPSMSSTAVVLVPPGPTWQPRIALSGQLVSTLLEEGGTSKGPGHDVATIPSSPISIVYGSDILCPSGEPVNVMKQSYSTSTRSKQVSYATTGQRTSASSFAGAWSTRLSAIEPMPPNYPTLAPPPSPPGNGESTASFVTAPGSLRPSMVDDASRRLEGGVRRPNTFGKESFLDFKVLFTGSRASSTKTKSSNRSSRSADGLSRSHSETDESAGTSKRDKGKGPRKARRTPVGGGGASNTEPARRSMDLPPPPPQKIAPEDAAT